MKERHAPHALCHARDLVPGGASPSAPRWWDLAPLHLVRRAAASDPSGPDGPRGPASPGLAAVFSGTGGPVAPRPDLGDCGVGRWDPPRTRGQWGWEAGVPPP